MLSKILSILSAHYNLYCRHLSPRPSPKITPILPVYGRTVTVSVVYVKNDGAILDRLLSSVQRSNQDYPMGIMLGFFIWGWVIELHLSIRVHHHPAVMHYR